MSVTSPTSASPSTSLLEWDEAAVQSYLAHIGLAQYEDVIVEHGITGDVLAMMDHATLQDMGITSVGHRLNLLRAVWELKKEQGIEMGDDDWRPQGKSLYIEEQDKKAQQAHVQRLWEMIAEQQDRLVHLERYHDRLSTTLEKNGIHVTLDVRSRSPWKDFVASKYSDSEDTERGDKADRRASKMFPASLASSTATHTGGAAPLSSDSATFQDSFTPTTNTTTYPFDSPSQTTNGTNGTGTGSKPVPIQALPASRLASSSTLNSANASSSAAVSMTRGASTARTQNSSAGTLSKSTSATSGSHTSPTRPQGVVSTRERDRAREAAANAAQSFKVTLDDPCWKVLPAALKKYKINDDWRVYALFICFAESVERCLAYDEKPLILFQKLKESNQKPRDIKSPITVAKQKQAMKLGLPPTTDKAVLPQLKPADDATISPTRPHGLGPAKRQEDGKTPAGDAFPELPSPGVPTGDGMRSAERPPLVDENGNYLSTSYAVAIYPYIADREDEFDVAVGMCYVVLNKQKGWFVVQRDRRGNGDIGPPDPSKTGWVPAGCLLELKAPITELSPAAIDAPYPGMASLPTSAVLSSSYLGVVLMQWEAKNDDEVSLEEGEKVRVYKKYCHWSYTIKTDSGDRGWVPSWFIGKLFADSQPGTAIPPSAITAGGTTSSTTAGTISAKEAE